jgi:hypothetical protein
MVLGTPEDKIAPEDWSQGFILESFHRKYSTGQVTGSTIKVEGSFYSENNKAVSTYGGAFVWAHLFYTVTAPGVIAGSKYFNASWSPDLNPQASWEMPFSLSIDLPPDFLTVGFDLYILPLQFKTDYSFWPTLSVSAEYIAGSSSFITGDVLEALLLSIPPEGGYVEARNLQTNQIYLSKGITNPSASWDENGAYAIACPAGTYEAFAWAPCYISQTKDDIEVVAQQNTTGINFRLAPSFAQINFNVVDDQDNPVQGARVSLTEMPWGFNLSSTTNSTGQTWLLLEGTIAPCAANYTLGITQGTQTATTTMFIAIPLCDNMTDPGQYLLWETDQIVWSTSKQLTVNVVLGAGTITPPPQPTGTTINPLLIGAIVAGVAVAVVAAVLLKVMRPKKATPLPSPPPPT